MLCMGSKTFFNNLGYIKMYKIRLISGLSFALALILTPTLPSLAFGADEVEEVVAVGSRREARSRGANCPNGRDDSTEPCSCGKGEG